MPGTVVNGIVPPGFDPFAQDVILYDSAGVNFTVPMQDILDWSSENIRNSINYATQIGASLIFLLVILVLTKREKRRSAVFILNALCLTLNTIRSILQCVYYNTHWNEFYAYFGGDYSHITGGDKGISIAAETLTLCLVIAIMISLSLQVHVACVTTPRVQRFWIMFLTTLIALLAIGFRFAVVVIRNISIMQMTWFHEWQWLVSGMVITQVIAIFFFFVVFTIKLGYALQQRKKLGMRQFGPMQVIFIMGIQSMIIPGKLTTLFHPIDCHY
jgi:pheromone alpha factor receptor